MCPRSPVHYSHLCEDPKELRVGPVQSAPTKSADGKEYLLGVWGHPQAPPPPGNSLLFLKLLLCRRVSEMRLGRDPWVTILLARGREERERNVRGARLRGNQPSIPGDSSQTKPRTVNQQLAQVPTF